MIIMFLYLFSNYTRFKLFPEVNVNYFRLALLAGACVDMFGCIYSVVLCYYGLLQLSKFTIGRI